MHKSATSDELYDKFNTLRSLIIDGNCNTARIILVETAVDDREYLLQQQDANRKTLLQLCVEHNAVNLARDIIIKLVSKLRLFTGLFIYK